MRHKSRVTIQSREKKRKREGETDHQTCYRRRPSPPHSSPAGFPSPHSPGNYGENSDCFRKGKKVFLHTVRLYCTHVFQQSSRRTEKSTVIIPMPNSEGSKLKRQIRRRIFLKKMFEERSGNTFRLPAVCLGKSCTGLRLAFFNLQSENMHSLHQRRGIKEGGGGNYFNTPGKHGNFFFCRRGRKKQDFAGPFLFFRSSKQKQRLSPPPAPTFSIFSSQEIPQASPPPDC